MHNELKLDKYRRIHLPTDLLEIVGMKGYNEKVALCSTDKGLLIRKLEEQFLKDCEIIAVVSMDSKGRIPLKRLISDENESYFKCFVLNGDIFISPIDNPKQKP